MKLTLDRMCIQTNKFCSSCEKKFENGEVGEIDIQVGNAILKIAKNMKFINEITLLKIAQTKSLNILIVKPNDVTKLIKAGQHLEKELKLIDHKEWLYLEKTNNSKKLIEDLLRPVNPVSISSIMLPPEGNVELKIQINEIDKDNLALQAHEISEITKILLNKQSHYSFV
ncbi:MAG: hypothetical protein OEZ01_09525 [Candidatus Heimdallarchaeota archaeon]|nr:hypothetical protein [Candidatus Heimdallarchaeota archaeon]MDH5646236.1 hypothetical protein [Candidatus Heimdallarchaeota archaeon]